MSQWWNSEGIGSGDEGWLWQRKCSDMQRVGVASAAQGEGYGSGGVVMQ